MEMQCFDEMSYWDSIGSLQLEEELFLSGNASNNWESGHELGTKFASEPPCGGGKPILPVLEKSDETDLLSGLDDLGDVPDAEFHDWMEMKFDLSDIDVLETLNSLTSEKPDEVISVSNIESENYSSLALTTEDEPLLLSISPTVVTPPDSPQDTSIQVPSSPNSNSSSSSSSSSSSEFLVSLTPPDTPPNVAAESAAQPEVAIYPEIFITVNLDDIVEAVSLPAAPAVAATPEEPPTRTSRRKPYSRKSPSTGKVKDYVPTVKKERKRDQNRDAATRYRLKKRAEADAILKDEMALQTKNKELTDQVNNISNEIKYLKNLLKEVFLARAQAKK